MNLRNESVLLIDHGMFFSTALRLARDFGKVGYHCHGWKSGFPSYHEVDVGEGFDEVTVVKNLWDEIDNYSLLAFPDTLDGDLQVHLRKQGHRVYGSGKGEELELYRLYFKKMLEAVGLPVQPYRMIKGIYALKKYLRDHEDKFVKFSLLRGISETFHHINWFLSEMRLDALEHELGARKSVTEFLVEDNIKTKIEYGYDGPCIDGKFPKVAVLGVERKDECLVAVVKDYEDLPDGAKLVNEKMAPVLAKYQYRNFWSTEIRETEDGTPYFIDPCCRMPSPSGEAQQELWGNLSEMMWHGAEGILVDPEPTAKYAVEAIIYAERADVNWQAIQIPDEYRDNVKLFYHTRIEGKDYIMPQTIKMNEVGAVVATGDDLDETVKECEKICKAIKGDKIEMRTHAIAEAIDEFEEMAKKGITDPIPA